MRGDATDAEMRSHLSGFVSVGPACHATAPWGGVSAQSLVLDSKAVASLAERHYVCHQAMWDIAVNRLADEDFALAEQFIGAVLERYKAGLCALDEGVGDIASLMAAVDRSEVSDHRAYMLAILATKDE